MQSMISRQRLSISIHAPLAGSDYKRLVTYILESEFQSTLPSRGATSWQG